MKQALLHERAEMEILKTRKGKYRREQELKRLKSMIKQR